jgi:CRP-like cAMP-binding protein
MPQSERVPHVNYLIDALPAKYKKHFLAGCQEIEIDFAEVLSEPNETISHVYFPTDSFISLVSPVDNHAGLEVALIGNEGMHGIALVLGVNVSSLHAVVQGEGHTMSMKAAPFRRELRHSPTLQRILNRYVYVRMTQLAQTAACTRFHVLEARLARWLLMTQDRAHSDTFYITHEFLAYMLGVRRVGITKAAYSLQQRKLIRYRRGRITILDRNSLEATSCGCYAADMASYFTTMG